MKFICNLFEPRYKITCLNHVIKPWHYVKNWNQMQNAADSGCIYRCEYCACMRHIISLRAQISQNVKYWYEICDLLVPLFHAL